MKDTYTLTATFSRSLSADTDVIANANAANTAKGRKALVRQLATELQAAYDHPDICPDGQFNIETITIDGVTYSAATGKQITYANIADKSVEV